LGFFPAKVCDKIHKLFLSRPSVVGPSFDIAAKAVMVSLFLPVLLFVAFAAALSIALVAAGRLIGPHRDSAVKRMPYESGMDPIHDSRRRFDVRFHLVAIAFLVFDVELLFLYPWAVASRPGAAEAAAAEGTNSIRPGIDHAVSDGLVSSRGLVFGEVMVFIALLGLGLAYAWRKGVFRWR
jgi:NADH-quinone oxidoreductase subunit A